MQVLVLCSSCKKVVSFLVRRSHDGSLADFAGASLPPELGHQLDQVVCGDLVALLLEEGREPRLSVQRSLVVFEY